MQLATNVSDVPAEELVAMAEQDRDTVVELRGITLDYGTHRVLEGFDLEVARGELVALLGPSGSGKTTVIRTLAGFLTPTEGSLLVGGHDVTRVPPHKRGIGVVFQSYALFPHMTVSQNLAYSMKVKRVGRTQIKRRCKELLELVRLEDQGTKKPGRLSGGQQQRVALARALAMDPEVLLLDEPLSNLDANLRRDVGAEIRRLQKETGTTSIMVTHDRQEAFGMADRIAVLRDGRIEQLGTPRELYRNPQTKFMAEFVGEANLIPGTVRDSDHAGLVTVQTGIGLIRATGAATVGAQVTLLIRPEDLSVGEPESGSTFRGVIRESFYYGSNLVIDVDVDGQQVSVVSSGSSAVPPTAGQAVQLSASAEDCLVLPGERA
jgi:putative spermidine/putrescine transport system ATP-binding protein